MCLSIPGKIIKIEKNKFLIDYINQKRTVYETIVDDLKVGDYVIVSSKIIVNKIPKEKAIKYLEILNEVGNENKL